MFIDTISLQKLRSGEAKAVGYSIVDLMEGIRTGSFLLFPQLKEDLEKGIVVDWKAEYMLLVFILHNLTERLLTALMKTRAPWLAFSSSGCFISFSHLV